MHELTLRGMSLMANQKNVQKLHRKQQILNDLFESTLMLLGGEANRLIKEEA